ncbi:hypothetical protein GCM10025875_28890 [Litorihabitans aurantiacus]|uniref:ROK family protein n=1 Tax=Litorihabitans aurantiacus TaxID=1930061 RepID=A0AA37XGL0_9MICO|nr:hypothetical protein GCM10025875_28890 [Litorihabitans aurantiacus]
MKSAAFQLGRLVASVVDGSLTDLVVLSGEGIGLAEAAMSEVRRGIAESRPPWASDVELDVHPMGFGAWARGAAVLAVQDFVTSAEDRRFATS